MAKRNKKVLRDNIQGVTKSAIRRLARRGGVKRISGLIYEETRGVLKVFLEHVIRDAITYTEHARRKTVTLMDVVYALNRQGRTIYGAGIEKGRRTGRKPVPVEETKEVEKEQEQLLDKLIICFGMHWGHPTDAVRMHSLEQMSQSTVISVSEYSGTIPPGREHISCDFKTDRALLRSIAPRIRMATQRHIICILDYWFLQPTYYASNYGENWLSSKCDILISAGATEVILPNDFGTRSSQRSSTGMQTMLGGHQGPELKTQWIGCSDNPLCAASNVPAVDVACNKFQPAGRPNNTVQLSLYVDPLHPFLRVR